MDEDLFCKPKRTIGRRDLFGVPYGLEVDRAFAPSLNMPIPSKDSLQEEPWNRPNFEMPDHRKEAQAKGLMQHELARDLGLHSSDKNQVLLTGTSNVSNVPVALPMESLPEHINLVQDELPKVLQRKLRK